MLLLRLYVMVAFQTYVALFATQREESAFSCKWRNGKLFEDHGGTPVLHFFAVAICGIGLLLLPFPSLGRMLIGARLISSASGIIFPIIKAEGVRQMFFPATVPAVYRAPPVD